MNKPALVFLICLCIAVVALWFVDNQEYAVPTMELDAAGNEIWYDEFEPESLIDKFDDFGEFLLLFACFSSPFLLMIESTFFPGVRIGWRRIIFLFQATFFSYMALMLLVSMTFKFWTEINFFIPFYLIEIYLAIGILWNVLLALPYTDKIKFIAKSFEILSLKKRKEHAG